MEKRRSERKKRTRSAFGWIFISTQQQEKQLKKKKNYMMMMIYFLIALRALYHLFSQAIDVLVRWRIKMIHARVSPSFCHTAVLPKHTFWSSNAPLFLLLSSSSTSSSASFSGINHKLLRLSLTRGSNEASTWFVYHLLSFPFYGNTLHLAHTHPLYLSHSKYLCACVFPYRYCWQHFLIIYF